MYMIEIWEHVNPINAYAASVRNMHNCKCKVETLLVPEISNCTFHKE